MGQRATPDLVFEFEPAPATIPRAASKVAAMLRPTFIEDLLRAGYADDLAEVIKARVQQRGTGPSGNRLRRYRPGTVRARRAMGLQTSPVNLTVTGKMLAAMRGTKLNDEPAVVFVGARSGAGISGLSQKALATFHEQGTPRMKARPFFALTRGETTAATGVAAVLFQVKTLPRVLATWRTA